MTKKQQPIYVTQPALPPLKEFVSSLEVIWESKYITNGGPFHQQFEKELAKYLGVKYVSLFTNGTLALITAIQALGIAGEVITTPFSFVATTHALWWNKIKPVFADIDDQYFNLDPKKVEAAITPQTTAILPVHVYGNPCDIKGLQDIADRYGLKIIYDAAHAFGVKIKGKSVLNFGDLSILSFHATKGYNTIEGGAIISHDKKTKEHIDYLKNFGFKDETHVIVPGINAKMNEVQAAYGLLQLKYAEGYTKKRQGITQSYRKKLGKIKGISFLQDMDNVKHSYCYFPILIDKEKYGKTRDELYEALKKQQIYGRRYFYPLISSFPMYSELNSASPNNLPVAEQAAKQVLCLPLYPDLTNQEVSKILKIIMDQAV